jgi:hypothetical protein
VFTPSERITRNGEGYQRVLDIVSVLEDAECSRILFVH